MGLLQTVRLSIFSQAYYLYAFLAKSSRNVITFTQIKLVSCNIISVQLQAAGLHN